MNINTEQRIMSRFVVSNHCDVHLCCVDYPIIRSSLSGPVRGGCKLRLHSRQQGLSLSLSLGLSLSLPLFFTLSASLYLFHSLSLYLSISLCIFHSLSLSPCNAVRSDKSGATSRSKICTCPFVGLYASVQRDEKRGCNLR